VRQILNVRFVAALAALLGLTLLVQTVFADDDVIDEIVEEQTEVPGRRVDFIAIGETIDRSPDFELTDEGVTEGILDVNFADGRIMRVVAGTPGEITCPNLRGTNRCVVLADLVGEAVLWFALIPRGPNSTAFLPPIVDLEDGYAIFENGWEISYPPVIERDERTCGDDITSFSDFLRRYGPNSVSIVDLETQQVSTVRCGGEVRPVAIPDLTDDPFQPVGL